MAESAAGNGIVEQFRLDFRDCWRRLPDKGLFSGLIAAWLVLFQFLGNSTLGYVKSPSLMRWMLDAVHPTGDYLASEESHAVIIPFVVLLLFWWKRKELLEMRLRNWWPGLGIISAALALHVGAYLIQQPKLSVIALFTGIYGIMGLVWGPQFLLGSFFPYFLLGFCMPLGTTAQSITTPLRHLVAIIVTGIAHAGLSPELVRHGTQLMDAHNAFNYDVAPACSGIRSLVSLLALTTIFGFLSFRSPWKRALMVLAAFPLAVIGNVTRISFTVMVAELIGQDAGSFVEQKFGFVTFAVAIGAVLLLEHWLREPKEQSLLLEPTTS